uniref:Uncharacterized protein n=1 Tax=Tetradesmus obliquus TaxID=3088 RepID=A0A383W3S2_TETOB
MALLAWGLVEFGGGYEQVGGRWQKDAAAAAAAAEGLLLLQKHDQVSASSRALLGWGLMKFGGGYEQVALAAAASIAQQLDTAARALWEPVLDEPHSFNEACGWRSTGVPAHCLHGCPARI